MPKLPSIICLPATFFFTLAPAAAAQDLSVKVVFEGTNAIAEVTAPKGSVIPACRAVEWQRFDASSGKYVAIPGAGCGPLEPARPIPEGTLRLPADVPMTGATNIRAIVVIGEGCTPGKPFPLAGCKTVRSAESKPATAPPPSEK
jgi:hypothetical protein